MTESTSPESLDESQHARDQRRDEPVLLPLEPLLWWFVASLALFVFSLVLRG